MKKPHHQDLAARTKQLALRIIRLYEALPSKKVAQIIGVQILRSGTSVGAHYREAKRARSTPEFISKIEVGLQELDESTYWLELLVESAMFRPGRLQPLAAELNDLIAIFVSIVKSAKTRKKP